jgi:MtN3 and saliva related transmembrane protein
MVFWLLVGFSAAFLTMFAFLPQIIKVIKTKSVKDVSLMTLVQLGFGVSLWIIYGVHLKDVTIIMANSVTLLSLIILLSLYCRLKK